MTGHLHSCANCHSVSRDGKTMGMDVDGPKNDKGLYALFPIQPQADDPQGERHRLEHVPRQAGRQAARGLHVAGVARRAVRGDHHQRSGPRPDRLRAAQGPQGPASENYYVANFKDYRFLQVFYPTRGILAWYSTASRRCCSRCPAPTTRATCTPTPPGARTASTWCLRARRPGTRIRRASKMAEHANDPNETQIQYDLYRIPFNGGQGGKAEPIAGASRQRHEQQLPQDLARRTLDRVRAGAQRPADAPRRPALHRAGRGRRGAPHACNTPLMNSWHSFSPNGRWLVFSSKSRIAVHADVPHAHRRAGQRHAGDSHREHHGRQPRGEHSRSS